MGLIKRKVEPPSPEQRAEELLRDIHDLRARLNQHLDTLVLQLKQSRDGADLPLGTLRAGLTGNDHCLCHCVARLLGDPNA